MGPAYLPHSKQELLDEGDRLDESPPGDEELVDDEHSDGIASLREENARLRGIVVKLTGLILRSVADRGNAASRTAHGNHICFETAVVLRGLVRR